ncbi:BTB/POZ domain-containing protein 17, partial [Anguilla anguilla]|uniref:BTB/POZ domain-containing protein 17 n=1 Tax=Anguilla anguilla TaxID=7936 RepID=UPI0015ACFD23
AAQLKAEGALESSSTAIIHSVALVQRMAALLEQGNSSDVVLQVQTGGSDQVKLFQAHALILSLHSNVFQQLLQSLNSSTLILLEPPDCTAVFHTFIRYLYCGELALRLEQAVPLHKLASRYGVQMLQEGLSLYMREHLASDPPGGHAVGWYRYAVQTGDAVLRDACLQYLCWNLSVALRSEEWRSVGPELLMTLLQRSDLVLHSELELLEALEAWIQRNRPDGPTVENALQAVRYAMISPSQLLRLQSQSPVLQRYLHSVRDLLYMSYQFHSAPPLQLAKYIPLNCSLFTPRNYLSAAWGAAWVIDSPARDDRSTSFQTQLGPSGQDSGKHVTWNALFSPRWEPLDRQGGAEGGGRAGRPRIIIMPASSSADLAGVSFQKTVMVLARQQGRVVVRHIYSFYQSSEETGDFLSDADLQRRSSEYLIDSALHLQIIIKPLYHTLA